MSAVAPEVITLPAMTGPQVAILNIDQQPERCWDVEGSPRAAKSWGAAFWIWTLAYRYPGIQVFYCRYKDDDLKTLRDVWAKVSVFFPEYLRPTWNTKEEAWDFPNGTFVGDVFTGSRVYLSSLRVSEAMDAAAIHGKYKGKTIAVVVIEEAQEVPLVNYHGLKERLSQSRTPEGTPYRYPLKIVLVHNSVDEDHWIAEEFPLDDTGDGCTREDHAHIRADLYSNAQNLGPDVMMGYEKDYPPGHVLRPAVIEGRRGVTLVGKPVYAGYFDRTVHLDFELGYNAYYPLLEGWDFGQEKPAVVWWQYITHLGALRILGAVKGKELFLETFAPKVLDIRQRWFPRVQETDVYVWCDPTGATGNQGRKETAVKLLHDLRVPARWESDANDAAVRYGAIQVIGGHMERTARDGSPAFLMNPRTIELSKAKDKGPDGEIVVTETPTRLLLSAFQYGYIWDEHAASDAHPNVRKPKKGTRFDDLMNCFAADTEVLTAERSWQPFSALDGTEALATVDLETDTLEYQQPSHLTRKEWDDELIAFDSERMAMLVTPDHRMVVHPWTSDGRDENGGVNYVHGAAKFCEAQSVLKSAAMKLAPRHWAGADVPYVEVEGAGHAATRQVDAGDWAEFLGWYIAEGSANSCIRTPGHGYQVCVAQTPGEKRVLLESLLARLPWSWYDRPNGLQASSKQLWMALRPLGTKYTKRVPEWIRQGSPDIIRRFLIGAVLGDGSVTPTGQRGYFTVSQQLADDMQELFLKLGRSAHVKRVAARPYCIDGRSGTNTVDQFHVWEGQPKARLVRGDRSEVARAQRYRGLVYCATVPNSTLVVRRNGKPCVAGNSGEYIVIGEQIRKPQSQEMWSADKRVAAMATRVAHAAVAASQRRVGPTGETLAEVEQRLIKQVKQMRPDRDPADRKPALAGRRGGW